MDVVLTEILRSHLQALGIPSFRAWAERAGVSEWQVRQLRRGKVSQLRLESLQRLALALNLAPWDLVQLVEGRGDTAAQPSAPPSASPSDPSELGGAQRPPAQLTQLQLTQLQAECDRLQTQLTQQQAQLFHQFQRDSLYTLEIWLKTWPKVVAAVQGERPDLPAKNILSLLQPLHQLLQTWGVETIGTIGAVLPFDPWEQELQPAPSEGNPQPGDPVTVKLPGYRHQGALLHRAIVTRI